ncbi:MAG TPA: DUF2442 domain-containing protein [Anaerohalosphaeraceae bacterium]|jgi:hypothetical protein|nr:DUF2442 domain-containing protein [Anaerohalosphaeraceae bacterium]HRT48990.1 DUF2442 domain-containing protein [Anaerohalosphaeraceae bacterium]HRT85113.1 DUF2442 domain-containing protein [Anaerohalosphaeraceae bacterium]
MYYDLREIKVMDGYKLFVRFEDGKQGIADLADIVDQGGVFEQLKDRALFEQASIDKDWAVLCWPGGIDIAPETLYSLVSDTRAQCLNKAVSDKNGS